VSVVDDVKQKLDIVDIVSESVKLRKSGRSFSGFCPFHPNTRTPAFHVFPDTQTWHCFGSCNTGGDVFTFLMKKENIDFGEALRRLAHRAGVELAREGPGEDAERKRLREILATTAAHFHYLLKNHPDAQNAREYLARRFITPDAIEQFQLGYSLNQWESAKSFLVGKGYALRDLEVAGVVIQGERGSHYDRFRGRLMFPIRNRNGEVIGFGARTLTGEDPKYLNSPQTSLFDKSATLYGLDMARDAIRAQNLAVIVEGYMDVIGAHQGGFKNVVASLGTALTQKQLELLKRLTKRYAFALDPDSAGEEATKRGLEVAREALDRKTVPVPMGVGLIGFEERLEAELLVISLPPGKDPDELIHEDPARWTELVSRAEPLVDFYFRVLTRDLDLKLPRDKSVAVRRLAPIIREIGDAVQRAHYTQQLARLVQVPEPTIAQQIAQKRAPRQPTGQTEELPAATLRPASRLEEYLLTLALHTPEHLSRIAFLDADDFDAADSRALFVALRDAERAAPTDLFDRDDFRASLDESLRSLCDQLLARAQELPELSEPDLACEIEKAALRLQVQHDQAEVERLQMILQDAELGADERVPLFEHVEFLRKRRAENQKALSARTLLRSRASPGIM
jgi:DNA primase